MDSEHWLIGGHVYRDRRTGQWVALSYTRVLGRFASRDEALAAVRADALHCAASVEERA